MYIERYTILYLEIIQNVFKTIILELSLNTMSNKGRRSNRIKNTTDVTNNKQKKKKEGENPIEKQKKK